MAKVIDTAYAPGEDDLVFPRDSDWYLNTWKPSGLLPVQGPWPLISQLVDRLMPVAEQRDHFLDVLAFVSRFPGKKVNHALVLTGVPGCGKTTLAEIASRLVGIHNSSTVDGHVLGGRWVNMLLDCAVLIIEEVAHGDRFDVSDKLKTLITQQHQQVESKGRNFYWGRTPNLVFVLSNDRRPLALGEGARREWMPDFVTDKPLDEAFFVALNGALNAELPGFAASLLERDISRFNPAAPPPMTSAKAEAIQDSRPVLDVQLEEMIGSFATPFDRDVVITRDVVHELRCAGMPATENQIRKALRRLDCRACINQAAPSPQWHGSPRVWAVRNAARWVDATKTELRDHICGSDRSVRSPAGSDLHQQLLRKGG
ncbi:DUF5906 domain-containing protein [Brevundimonas sp. TWP3-1-2b1]|uniref:DUF5906 domain-containing protein n=1 Tax=Brevundimonas sp. TWP3-1-2b1 TaxID=2804650 RepID=UPI003CF3AE78